MSKLCRMFFVVFVSVCSLVRAEDLDKYQITVSKIDEELHCLALSNGMICHVVEKEWGKEKSVAVGDDVIVFCNLWHTERKGSLKDEGDFQLFLKGREMINLSVRVSEESNPQLLTFVSHSFVCTKPAGWFSSEEHMYVIELSDGSKWGVQREIYISAQQFAKEGDRIFVSKISSDLWVLFNVDRLQYGIDNSQETVGSYRFIEVVPYQEKNSQ